MASSRLSPLLESEELVGTVDASAGLPASYTLPTCWEITTSHAGAVQENKLYVTDLPLAKVKANHAIGFTAFGTASVSVVLNPMMTII